MARSDRAKDTGALSHMTEVLAAEARVRRLVESCQDDLNRQISEQQEWARALQRRTHARLTRLHTHCDQRIQTRIGELRDRAEREAPPIDLDTADRESLGATIGQLADQLIGRSSG